MKLISLIIIFSIHVNAQHINNPKFQKTVKDLSKDQKSKVVTVYELSELTKDPEFSKRFVMLEPENVTPVSAISGIPSSV